MAYSIFKYTLDPSEIEHFIELPHGTEILSATAQYSDIVFWAKVKNDEHLTERVGFLVVPAGSDNVKDDDRFIGTCLLHADNLIFFDNLVFHVFVRGNY
jgi:hypothetical protein